MDRELDYKKQAAHGELIKKISVAFDIPENQVEQQFQGMIQELKSLIQQVESVLSNQKLLAALQRCNPITRDKFSVIAFEWVYEATLEDFLLVKNAVENINKNLQKVKDLEPQIRELLEKDAKKEIILNYTKRVDSRIGMGVFIFDKDGNILSPTRYDYHSFKGPKRGYEEYDYISETDFILCYQYSSGNVLPEERLVFTVDFQPKEITPAQKETLENLQKKLRTEFNIPDKKVESGSSRSEKKVKLVDCMNEFWKKYKGRVNHPTNRRGGFIEGNGWTVEFGYFPLDAELGEDYEVALHWGGDWVAVPYKKLLENPMSLIDFGKSCLATQNAERDAKISEAQKQKEVEEAIKAAKAAEESARIREENRIAWEKGEREREEQFHKSATRVSYHLDAMQWLKKLPDLSTTLGGNGLVTGFDTVHAGRKWIAGICFGPDPKNREGYTFEESVSQGKSILAVQFSSQDIWSPKEGYVKFRMTLIKNDGTQSTYEGYGSVKNGNYSSAAGNIPAAYYPACVAVVQEYFWKGWRRGEGVKIY